jgi:hypothetical protein
MDDIKIVIWIIIGIIYLFSRRKKTVPPPPGRQRTVEPEETDAPSGPAPKTFEELLREIQGMKEPTPTPARRMEPKPEFVDYDDSIEEEKSDLEEVGTDYRKKDNIYQVYEEAKAQAFHRPSLEETIKLEDTIVRFKQFKGYEKHSRPNLANEVLKDFKDPQGFKKAFIMSEILRTKF